jgi:formate dehydrogenase major subunit
MGQLDEVPEKVFRGYAPAARVKMPQLAASTRLGNFNEVETGFTEAMARTEAQRCIECGCQSSEDCRLRQYAGLYDADARRYKGACRDYDRTAVPPGIIYDAHKCIQCRTCIRIADEVLGSPLMRVMDRGFSTRIVPVDETLAAALPSSGLIQIVENCPTGALSFEGIAAQSVGRASEAR